MSPIDKPVVAIDVQTTTAQKSGLGFYTANLIRELPKTAPEFTYHFIAAKQPGDMNTTRRFMWDQFGFPRAARGADILHQPGFSTPLFHGRSKVVVTSHDLVSLIYRDLPFWPTQYFGKWMPFSHRFADHIIADSECTKRDLMRFLQIPEEIITVVYLAADPSFKPDNDAKKLAIVKEKFHIPGEYLIHVGNLVPRKNIDFLVRAFGRIADKYPTVSLVIAGGKNWYQEKIAAEAARLGITDRVIFTGYVAEDELPVLLTGAAVAPFPSLYEGFGLPPLQAMQAGVPVISSNASSLPEVVGEAGLLLDPHDEEVWAQGLHKVLSSTELRNDLRTKGFARAKKFTWEKTARQTADIYQRVLGHK